MLFDAHWHAFQIFGGIPKRGIYDNMKTAVDSVGRGKERRVNQRFTAMVAYLFDAQFCNPASGWEKGQIEKNVQDSRQRLWQGAPDFQSLADLNVWLEHRCKALWSELRHPELDQTVQEAFADEQGELMALPNAFDAFVEQTKRVLQPALFTTRAIATAFCQLRQQGHQPSDLCRQAGDGCRRPTHCRASKIVWQWPRSAWPTQYDWHHYLSVLQKKPGALRNGGHLLNCHPRSRSFNPSCCNAPAVTVTWWKFWPLYCTTMKVRYSVLWNWHWSVASHRRSMCLSVGTFDRRTSTQTDSIPRVKADIGTTGQREPL
ncbi:transposase [Escherichia coli]|nr:transposase [Escherichia coli]